MKLWFGYSEDDNAKRPDETFVEHAYSADEITQAYADTVEVVQDRWAEITDNNPDPDEFINV